MTTVPGYKESLQIFRDLLEQENLDQGLANEYVRGGVELLADLFGVEGDFHAERIDKVLADLRALGVLPCPNCGGPEGYPSTHAVGCPLGGEPVIEVIEDQHDEVEEGRRERREFFRNRDY